jgi:hypothetical protein
VVPRVHAEVYQSPVYTTNAHDTSFTYDYSIALAIAHRESDAAHMSMVLQVTYSL